MSTQPVSSKDIGSHISILFISDSTLTTSSYYEREYLQLHLVRNAKV